MVGRAQKFSDSRKKCTDQCHIRTGHDPLLIRVQRAHTPHQRPPAVVAQICETLTSHGTLLASAKADGLRIFAAVTSKASTWAAPTRKRPERRELEALCRVRVQIAIVRQQRAADRWGWFAPRRAPCQKLAARRSNCRRPQKLCKFPTTAAPAAPVTTTSAEGRHRPLSTNYQLEGPRAGERFLIRRG